MQVSFSLSASFLPADVAVILSFAFPGLMPRTERLTGTAIPGAVHPGAARSRPASALASACAVGLLAGLTLGGALSAPGEHDPRFGTLMQAWRSNVHVPSAWPSMSHDVPSVQVTLIVLVPANATKQSVEAGPPPAAQFGGTQSAAAEPATRNDRTTRRATRNDMIGAGLRSKPDESIRCGRTDALRRRTVRE